MPTDQVELLREVRAVAPGAMGGVGLLQVPGNQARLGFASIGQDQPERSPPNRSRRVV